MIRFVGLIVPLTIRGVQAAATFTDFFMPFEVMPFKLSICSRMRAPLRPVRDNCGRPLQT